MEPRGPGELPGERLLLQRLLSHYREPSAIGDQLQLFTQLFVLRTLSRSLSSTLPWEVRSQAFLLHSVSATPHTSCLPHP
jgi:hypothetical protein